MDDLEKQCIASLPFRLPFYFRYVDDIITAVPADEIDKIRNTFNSYNHKIQFTVEEESDNKLCFLDVLIIRTGENIKTNWYQKPTYSGRILNFYSHHPLHYKINVINNLVDRGIILAHKNFHTENLKKIQNILSQNNYPTTIINSTIKHRLNYLLHKASITGPLIHHPPVRVVEESSHSYTRTNKQKQNSASQTQKYVSLPYVKGLSEKLSSILKPFNVKIAPRNTNDLSHLFKSAKDPTPKLETAHVVYNIPCIDCTANYIGTTKRPLKNRIQEHKKDVYNPPEKWTALTKHTWRQDHKFNFDQVKIVDRSNNYKKRMILEMTHIASNAHTVNQRTDTDNLSAFYFPLLNKKT